MRRALGATCCVGVRPGRGCVCEEVRRVGCTGTQCGVASCPGIGPVRCASCSRCHPMAGHRIQRPASFDPTLACSRRRRPCTVRCVVGEGGAAWSRSTNMLFYLGTNTSDVGVVLQHLCSLARVLDGVAKLKVLGKANDVATNTGAAVRNLRRGRGKAPA